MNTTIHQATAFVGRHFNEKCLQIECDLESRDYFGATFHLETVLIQFRKAKVTPKKIGLFVALWKRNESRQTEPFHYADAFAVYIIEVEQEKNRGFFVFPKAVLIEHAILSAAGKEGKRGFRLYPPWSKTDNKQAMSTQKWQLPYFVDAIIEKKQVSE